MKKSPLKNNIWFANDVLHTAKLPQAGAEPAAGFQCVHITVSSAALPLL